MGRTHVTSGCCHTHPRHAVSGGRGCDGEDSSYHDLCLHHGAFWFPSIKLGTRHHFEFIVIIKIDLVYNDNVVTAGRTIT